MTRRPRATGAPRPSRRGLVRAAGLAAFAGTGLSRGTVAEARPAAEPFWGSHQGGITTPAQRHTYTAAFDLVTARRDDVTALCRTWTQAAAEMCGGAEPAQESGEVQGLSVSRLTLTFGFGAGLFVKNGKDRYGFAARRPQALVDLPVFEGDALVETATGGDLSVQACADDPQVAFHAVRRLSRLAHGTAELRWAQTGFIAGFREDETPRNLMGFKDGTANPPVGDAAAMGQFVWVGDEGPNWMQGGSYVVFRRIRMALEHWDRMPLDFQERTFGRDKISGAPLGRGRERDPADLGAAGADGDPVIPASAHIRLAAAAQNGGARVLRRAYSYNDGANVTTERWPPWRRRLEYDAGLFFVCYQRDPRTGFIRIFDKLSRFDMLNQFVTHTGGGLFACPGGIAPGKYLGQPLFETA